MTRKSKCGMHSRKLSSKRQQLVEAGKASYWNGYYKTGVENAVKAAGL